MIVRNVLVTVLFACFAIHRVECDVAHTTRRATSRPVPSYQNDAVFGSSWERARVLAELEQSVEG